MASPQITGRYAIYGKIASGGMASVHFGRLAGAAGFARTVAIKRLHPHLAADPQFVATIVDEARLAARIHHPNVVSTLDVVALEGELLVVMDYIRGDSLSKLLRAEAARGRRIPLPIASAIVAGALDGLQAAHEATNDRGAPLGIVHRDVSPQNILVGIDGAPRVIDFGIAKAAGRLQTTSDGAVKGKMAYMAPEQLAAQDVTRRVDLYAMAAVLWEIVTGKRLFRAESDAVLYGQVLAGAREKPSRHAPGIPAELDAFVMKGLAKNPAERFATAGEMAERLRRVVPPAFPTDVGAWVEEVVCEPLAARDAMLAEIESGVSDLPAKIDGTPRPEELPTLASQPSGISVETPTSPHAGGRSLAKVAAGIAAAAVVVAGAAALYGRRLPDAARAAPQSSAPVETASPPPLASSPPLGSSPPPVSPEPAAAQSARPPASAPARAIVRAPPRPAPPPKAAASGVLFKKLDD